MKLEEAEKMQNVFKSNLNEISKGRYKSKEPGSTLKILNCFTNHEKLFIKLFNYYSLVISEAKYRTKHVEGVKVLITKQMLKRLPIALSLLPNSQNSIQQYYQFNGYNIKNEYYIYQF